MHVVLCYVLLAVRGLQYDSQIQIKKCNSSKIPKLIKTQYIAATPMVFQFCTWTTSAFIFGALFDTVGIQLRLKCQARPAQWRFWENTLEMFLEKCQPVPKCALQRYLFRFNFEVIWHRISPPAAARVLMIPMATKKHSKI